MRIRARAVRRCGELLGEIEKAQGGRPFHKTTSRGAPTSRANAATEAGLSKDQAVTAIRMTPDEEKAQAYARRFPTKRFVWIEHNGERLMAAQWGRRFGIDGGVIASRMRAGWTFEEAISVKPKKLLSTLIEEANRVDIFAPSSLGKSLLEYPEKPPLERVMDKLDSMEAALCK
jgi:hypothetical protein